jgi:hypothetical protein
LALLLLISYFLPLTLRVLFPFNLVFQFQFVMYHAFQHDPYSFDFFTWPFYKSFFFLNFTLHSKFILCYFFFQFDL